jgi:acyl carrier protein
MEQDLSKRVERAFARTFGRQVPFDPQLARSTEPRWTSLKHVELVIALEAEFGLRFDGGDATDMTSVPAIVERLRTRLS